MSKTACATVSLKEKERKQNIILYKIYSFDKNHAGYIQSCMRAGYIQSCMRAGYIQSCMRAGFIQSCMRARYIQSCMRAGYIQSCMMAGYIQSCMRAVAVLVPVAEVPLHMKKFCFIQPNSKLSSLSFVCYTSLQLTSSKVTSMLSQPRPLLTYRKDYFKQIFQHCRAGHATKLPRLFE